MRTLLSCLLVFGVVLAFTSPAPAEEKKVPEVLKFKLKGIDGKDVDLSSHAGKVVLFVNVASRCGYTPQYAGLQELHNKYAKEGLVIIGVPSNEFGFQEPGTDEQIVEFCSSKYGVRFAMLSKTKVNGKDANPLYKYLTSKDTNPKSAGPIKWNFTKFLGKMIPFKNVDV